MDRRVEMDKKSRRDMVGNVSVTQPKKRSNMGEEKGRPSKKRKYVLVGPEWGTKAKKNQGLDCKVDESTTPLIEGNTAAVLKSGTVDRNCSTAPLAEGNNVKTGGKIVMKSSLREGNIIVEPVDQNLNLSTFNREEHREIWLEQSGGVFSQKRE